MFRDMKPMDQASSGRSPARKPGWVPARMLTPEEVSRLYWASPVAVKVPLEAVTPPLKAAEAADTDAGDALIDRYHFLRGFAASHAEAAAIYRAID